jgi:hypothetical protein
MEVAWLWFWVKIVQAQSMVLGLGIGMGVGVSKYHYSSVLISIPTCFSSSSPLSIPVSPPTFPESGKNLEKKCQVA